MKKIFKSLMFLAIGAFALASCEDVPAPYVVPEEGGGSSTNILFSVDLTQGQGLWTTQDKGELTGVWYHNSQYGMMASGYKNNTNNASESWLISPQIDLTKATKTVMTLEEAVNKIGEGNVAENMTVWVSTDNGETWEPVSTDTRPAGTSWTFQKDDFDLSAYDGKVIKVGFKYISTTESAGTWEIKGITFNGEGEATIEGGGDTPSVVIEPEGDGTVASPYNVARLQELINADNVPTSEIYIKGKISKIKSLDTSKYTRAQYYISDDGTTNNQFYVYNGLYLNGENFTANDQIKVGDEVIIFGKLGTYQGEYQVAQNSKIISLNGKTEGGDDDPSSGDDDPGTSTTSEYMSIANLPPDITLGNYGTQLVSDESTWLSWTWNGVDFKGARICKATDANGGGIQVQCKANDDVANQGFIFNSSAWSSDIQKITIVLRVKINADPTKMFDPAYTLYAGFEAHPTTTAITPTSTTEDVDGFRIYTQVFDLANAGAKFFTIFNNLKGALYIDKIYVE